MGNSKLLGYGLTIIGLVMTAIGLTSEGVVDAFNIYWMAAGAALISGVLLSLKRDAEATYFARILVGAIFLVSGLIKANDTMGFGFKLEEYFDENALGSFWALFHDYSLSLALVISGVEVLLGLAVLFGIRLRLVSVILLGMTLFFGWLTYFTAQCNDAQLLAMETGESFSKVCVTDCGCFGDALRGSVGRSLTPWESFYKDLGLLFLTLVLLWNSGKIKLNAMKDDIVVLPSALVVVLLFGGWLFGWMFPTWFFIASTIVYFGFKMTNFTEVKKEFFIVGALAVITYAFAIHTYSHLPIIDYRPYAEGKNINDQMRSAEELGLVPTIYANVYKLKNTATGELKTMNSKVYLDEKVWEDKTWEIVETLPEPIVIQKGYEAPIASYNIMNEEGSDIGMDLLADENYSFMVVMYNIDKASNSDAAKKLATLSTEIEKGGWAIYGVTSSTYETTEDYRHEYQLAFPFYSADEIFLKTIVRSNPGLVMLKNGVVVAKWHANDFPSFEELKSNYLK
jgi:uncharacterized membrane protein YphA (DoxX/SURF4 family)